MAFLTDSNVLSELTKPQASLRVARWLEENETDIVISSISLGEIRLGVLKAPPGRKREKLERWFIEFISAIKCLPWDGACALRWAELLVQLRAKGRSLPLLDSMIAATALVHDLIIVTRNVRDFESTGADVINPFE